MYSCETVWVKMILSKGWLQSEITVQTLMEKKQTEGEGGMIKENECSGVK